MGLGGWSLAITQVEAHAPPVRRNDDRTVREPVGVGGFGGSGGVVGGLGGGTMLALRSQRIAHQGFGIGSKGNFDAHSFVI